MRNDILNNVRVYVCVCVGGVGGGVCACEEGVICVYLRMIYENGK